MCCVVFILFSLLGKVEVWVKLLQGNVICLMLSPLLTVKQLYEQSGLGIENLHIYLITVNKKWVWLPQEVGSIQTSEDQPLIIEKFYYWVQYEDSQVTGKACRPTTTIVDLPDALPIAFHKRKRVCESLPIWSLFTSKTDPLVFKGSKLTMDIDGHIKVTEDVYDDLEALFSAAGDVEHVVRNELGRQIDNLDDFILDTKSDYRRLYLKKSKPSGPSYRHSRSVSVAAKEKPEEITKYSKGYKVYHHWLSLSVYDHYSHNPSPEAVDFAKRLRSLMQIDQYDPIVLGHLEYTYSSVFFRALDRFLFPDSEIGCVLHEPVLAKDSNNHTNRPDGYIALLKDGLPSSPILVSDFKKDDKEYGKAVNESLGYFQCVVDVAKLYVPILVMPCTPNKLSLFLCWPTAEKAHATIKILEEIRSDETQFAKFFNALKFAVGAVIDLKGRFQVEPKKGVQLIEELKSPKVYKHENLVYKLFEGGDTKTNVDVVKRILGDDYLSNLEAEQLTSDHRYWLLTYQYIPATTRKVHTLDNFRQVAAALQKLHNAGYVHADVRKANIVCTDDGAKLIDFDLTDKIGTHYPSGYNTDFEERHPQATDSDAHSRQIVHDRHSLFSVIKMLVNTLSNAQKKYLDEQRYKETDLSSIINTCKLISDE